MTCWVGTAVVHASTQVCWVDIQSEYCLCFQQSKWIGGHSLACCNTFLVPKAVNKMRQLHSGPMHTYNCNLGDLQDSSQMHLCISMHPWKRATGSHTSRQHMCTTVDWQPCMTTIYLVWCHPTSRPGTWPCRWMCGHCKYGHRVYTVQHITAPQNRTMLSKAGCYDSNSLHEVASKLVWGNSEQAEKNCIATWSIHAVPKGHKPCKNATWPPRDVTARTVFLLPLHSCMHTRGCLKLSRLINRIKYQNGVAQWQYGYRSLLLRHDVYDKQEIDSLSALGGFSGMHHKHADTHWTTT